MTSIKFYYDSNVTDNVKLGRAYTYQDLPQGIPSYAKYIQSDSIQQAFDAGAKQGINLGLAYGGTKAREIVDTVIQEGKQIIEQKDEQIAHQSAYAAKTQLAIDQLSAKQKNRTFAVKAWAPNSTEPMYFKSISAAVDGYGSTNKVAQSFIANQKKANNITKAPTGQWVQYKLDGKPSWAIKRRYKDSTEAAYFEHKSRKTPNSPQQKSYAAAIGKVPKK